MNEIKEVKIQVPEGYEIDKDKSTFENIIFKPIIEHKFGGYYINVTSDIKYFSECDVHKEVNYNVFTTEEGCKCSLALSQLSQIVKDINTEYKNEGRIYMMAFCNTFKTVFPGLLKFYNPNGIRKFMNNTAYMDLVSTAYRYLYGQDVIVTNLIPVFK